MNEDQRSLRNDVYIKYVSMGHAPRQYTYFLVHPSYDGELYLRNQLFAIMINMMLESATELENKISPLFRRATDLNEGGSIKHLSFIRMYLDGVAHALREMTNDELIMTQYFRDQFQHGTPTYANREFSRVKILIDGSVRTIKMPTEEVHDTVNRILGESNNPVRYHEVWTPMRHRFTDCISMYWQISRIICNNEYMNLVHQEIYANRTDLALEYFPTDSFIKLHMFYVMNGEKPTLRSLRAEQIRVGRPPPDPVFHIR